MWCATPDGALDDDGGKPGGGNAGDNIEPNNALDDDGASCKRLFEFRLAQAEIACSS